MLYERVLSADRGGVKSKHHDLPARGRAASGSTKPDRSAFFSASASHELTGICVHLRLIGIGKNSGQSRACRDGQRAPEDPGGIGAEREDRESTPPDGARSGQGSPPAPFFCFTKPMTGNSIETEEMPCPLTRSDWISFRGV